MSLLYLLLALSALRNGVYVRFVHVHPHFICVFPNRQVLSGVYCNAGAFSHASPACLRIGDNPHREQLLRTACPVQGQAKSKRGQKAGAPRQCFGPELFLVAELRLGPRAQPQPMTGSITRVFLCQQVMMTISSVCNRCCLVCRPGSLTLLAPSIPDISCSD